MQVKAAVTLGYQQPFVIKDVEVAPPGKDEILVKIVATGVCHTDAVMRDNPGVVPMPAILGHEGAGIVASVGEAVLNRLKPVVGESLVVFGCGAVGLSAIMAAKLTGCSQIIAVDIHASRLALARELGATHQINGKEQDAVAVIKQITGKGAHYAVETTGVSAIVLQAVHAVKPLGTVAIVGFTGDITLNVQNDLMAEGKSLVGVIEGDAVPALFIPLLVQLYKQGKFPIDKLIARYPLADINQAFADSASGKVIKPVVVM